MRPDVSAIFRHGFFDVGEVKVGERRASALHLYHSFFLTLGCHDTSVMTQCSVRNTCHFWMRPSPVSQVRRDPGHGGYRGFGEDAGGGEVRSAALGGRNLAKR
jgi:hypothetical protein